MRFAEHMLLNAKIYPLTAYTRRADDGARCALGLVETTDPYAHAECLYPWLESHEINYPCDCFKYGHIPFPMDNMNIVIVHLFNQHVMQGKHSALDYLHCLLNGTYQQIKQIKINKPVPWTLEQLADFIEANDPTKEPVNANHVDEQAPSNAVPTNGPVPAMAIA